MRNILSHHIFQLLVKVAGALAIAVSAMMLGLELLMGQNEAYKGIYKSLGSLAEYSAIAGGSAWLVRHLAVQLKKRNVAWQNDVRELLLFLKKYHAFVGWIALFLAISHGSYFLFHSHVDKMGRVYSGIGAFASLLLVIVAGYVLQTLGKGKNIKNYKKVHQITALLFGIFLVVHLLM